MFTRFKRCSLVTGGVRAAPKDRCRRAAPPVAKGGRVPYCTCVTGVPRHRTATPDPSTVLMERKTSGVKRSRRGLSHHQRSKVGIRRNGSNAITTQHGRSQPFPTNPDHGYSHPVSHFDTTSRCILLVCLPARRPPSSEAVLEL